MPHFADIGTPCFHMCASNVVAGCNLWGVFLSSWGTLASTHAWKNTTVLYLTARHFSDLLRSGGRKGFGVGDFWDKVLFKLYLVMPLVAIPATLSKEVGGSCNGI